MKGPQTAWDHAADLLGRFLAQPGRKADVLLDGLPAGVTGAERRRCHHLFAGAIRHGHRVRAALAPLLRAPVRPKAEAVLLLAGYELLEAAVDDRPKVVHHAVERAKRRVSEGEARLVNAVLRKLGPALDVQAGGPPAAAFSHPEWLVERWRAAFGEDAGARLLTWNQRIPEHHVHLPDGPGDAAAVTEPADWPQFHRFEGGTALAALKPLLADGRAFIRDPSTRLAPELLAVKPGEAVLDLCAAPGGKAFHLAHALGGTGRLVLLDLPGRRQQRLRENLEALRRRFPQLEPGLLEADLLQTGPQEFAAAGLPPAYDAVLLDAPCSNTGVIQRRPDVKWRLTPRAIAENAALQARLLAAAARLAGDGGRLVYSSCSLEAEENRQVVEGFLAGDAGKDFELAEAVESRPWESGHDGAGAFLLRRQAVNR